jgi:hypothetical protein
MYIRLTSSSFAESPIRLSPSEIEGEAAARVDIEEALGEPGQLAAILAHATRVAPSGHVADELRAARFAT